MRRYRASFTAILASFLIALHSALAADADQRATLQTIGTEIKAAIDNTETTKISSKDLERFERALENMRSNGSLESKRSAVALALGSLRDRLSRGASDLRKSSAPQRVDLETTAKGRGDLCSRPLGVSQPLPVKLTLAPSHDAWFRFDASSSGHFRFRTGSSGPDPAIDVFKTCASSAVASNDDDFGLDAAATISIAKRDTVFLHVTNSGNGGSVVLNIDDVSQSISGKITDEASGAGLSHTQVVFYNDDNGALTYAAQTTTDADGYYSSNLPVGAYYVFAYNDSHVLTVYPSATCSYGTPSYDFTDCDLTSAQTIAVATGANIAGINIAMSSGHRIYGQIMDSANNPIVGSVFVYDQSNAQLGSASSDDFGRYSISTLTNGVYKLAAIANGYGSQMYDRITCAGSQLSVCDLHTATSITIANADISNANFNLPVLASIQGIVSGPGFTPDVNCCSVYLLDQYGDQLGRSSLDADGHYSVGPVSIGTYTIYVVVPGFFSQIFNTVDCTSYDCSADIASATPIVINNNGQIATANFQIDLLPTVQGHVQDAQSGLPLANVTVEASITPPTTFYSANSAVTNTNGDYTLTGTLAGTYYLWALSTDHIDEIYPNILCETSYGFTPPPCDVSNAQLLTIAPGQIPPAFNFSLQQASAIAGRATINAGEPTDIPAITQISVYNTAGAEIASANTDGSGNYVVNDLAPGTYYVGSAAYYSGRFVNQIWKLKNCTTNCVPTTGTPVVVGSQETVANINFDLIEHDAVVGRVTDTDGQPMSGVIIDLFSTTDTTSVVSTATDTDGNYAAVALANNSYFVATEVSGGYYNQVYSGVDCPFGPAYFGLCPLTNATAIPLSYTSSLPHVVNFTLKSNDPIFKDGFDPP